MGIGKDHTIFSLMDGLVKFEKYGPDKKKVVFFFFNPTLCDSENLVIEIDTCYVFLLLVGECLSTRSSA